MRIKICKKEAKETVQNIAGNVPKAFMITGQYKSVLREVAVEKYDWKNVAKIFADGLKLLMAKFQ